MSALGRRRNANGYVLNIAPGRRAVLLEAVDLGRNLAEVVPDFTHNRDYPLLCFISFEDDAITHIALGRLGHRAATGMMRLNLQELTELSSAVLHSDLIGDVPARFSTHVKARFTNGGLLPPASFTAVVDSLRGLLPESNAILDRFNKRRLTAISELSPRVRGSLAYQKEAVATALALSGFKKGSLLGWQPILPTGPVKSFIDGLPTARLLEDQMLLSDSCRFPGFDSVRTTQHSAAVFVRDRVILTIVMANRLPLEQQLGVDLIYANETYKSFVAVQYKAMEIEHSEALFRLPNSQLAVELQRMELQWSELQKIAGVSGLGGFRLKPNPFYLKLCPRLVFDPDNESLVKGMYLPLEYWRTLESDPIIIGPRGGRAVTFSNVGRYLNNSLFADLVADGWIGTTDLQSTVLEQLIRQTLESGRVVVVAHKRELTPAELADRGRNLGSTASENADQ